MAELTRRYVVMTMATEAPFDVRDPEGVFVLKPWKDPAAVRALRAYADCCYPELSRDLAEWIRAIERGPMVHGDVGRRNEDHTRVAAPSRRTPRPTRAPKARRRAASKPARSSKKKRRS
jgi:hypothetical protein